MADNIEDRLAKLGLAFVPNGAGGVEIDTVEPVSETVFSDKEIEQIVEDVQNHRGDYVAGVEALAALYRGERDWL